MKLKIHKPNHYRLRPVCILFLNEGRRLGLVEYLVVSMCCCCWTKLRSAHPLTVKSISRHQVVLKERQCLFRAPSRESRAAHAQNTWTPVAFGKASLKARRGKGVPAGAPFSDWLMVWWQHGLHCQSLGSSRSGGCLLTGLRWLISSIWWRF